jgi:mono/diheme cytochrome c family protein
MDFQQRFEAQERNDFFADGRAMRAPVEGTVPYGQTLPTANKGFATFVPDPLFLKADTHLYAGRGADGRLVDTLPSQLPLSEELIERGQARYNIYCTPCHDGGGTGEGLVMDAGFSVKPRSYHDPAVRAMPLGYFYDVMTNGRGVMQSYAAQVPVEDRWAIAAYIRTLQISQMARLSDVPADVATENGWGAK